MNLKKASGPWDQPRPGIRHAKGAHGKHWGPVSGSDRLAKQDKLLSQPGQAPPPQKTKTSLDSPWLINPPDLPGDQRSVSGSARAVLSTAKQYLGVPYRYGGESPQEGFDCSGFVHFVFGKEGVSMERTADRQYLQGESINKSELSPGDLVFFSSSGKYVDHVGIYAGDQLFIHAPRTGRTVSYDSLASNYYQAHYRGARRLLK